MKKDQKDRAVRNWLECFKDLPEDLKRDLEVALRQKR